MTAGKTLDIVDSSDSSVKLSVGQSTIDAHSLKITALGDATSATDALNR
jgi:hypothetical protein